MFTVCAIVRLNSTIVPARMRTALSIVILLSPVDVYIAIYEYNYKSIVLMSKKVSKQLAAGSIQLVAMRFRALGEVSRLRIVQALLEGDKNVTEIVEHSKLSQPNVSRHLLILVNSGLVGRRKVGLNAIYSIIDEGLPDLCTIVCKSIESKH